MTKDSNRNEIAQEDRKAEFLKAFSNYCAKKDLQDRAARATKSRIEAHGK